MSTGIRNNYICTQSVIGGSTADAVPGFPTSVTVPASGTFKIAVTKF